MGLEALDRLDRLGCEEPDLIGQAREPLERVEEQPSSADVLPVTIWPSGSSMAAAGWPVASASSRAGRTTGRSMRPTPTRLISREMRLD